MGNESPGQKISLIVLSAASHRVEATGLKD
jgi:hypothetical protein